MGEHDDDEHLRGSMHEDDARHDRRSMMRKLHSRSRNRSFTDVGGNAPEDDGGELDDSYAHEILEEVQAAHEEDEYNLAGRVEDGDEVMDALNQALTSPPVQWWSMRRQWQKRRGGGVSGRGVMNFLGNHSGHGMADDDAEQPYADDQDENMTALDYAGLDASARSAGGGALLGSLSDAGVVGHPVMMEAPIDIGYDVAAYRKNPFLRSGKRKRSPTVVYVTKETLHRRRAQQFLYLHGAC